jgi:hypothetical protein
MSAPIAPQRVLPTLNADGTRNRIRPRLYPGRYYRYRRVVAIALMVAFVALPLLTVGGKPLILLDVLHREFTLFGRTFLPTDGVLLMLLLLVIFVGIIATTALVGRAWCGWACPQTVYMEFLFRPIERLFEGKREQQLRLDREGGGARRFFKNVVYLLLALLLANVFLAYFVGARTLAGWMTRSPLEHFTPFLVVAVTTALVFFDFAYFREQMCTVVCPYARLQSALLDRSSLLVGYDAKRGEPRVKGRPRPGFGDCIDCNACAVVSDRHRHPAGPAARVHRLHAMRRCLRLDHGAHRQGAGLDPLRLAGVARARRCAEDLAAAGRDLPRRVRGATGRAGAGRRRAALGRGDDPARPGRAVRAGGCRDQQSDPCQDSQSGSRRSELPARAARRAGRALDRAGVPAADRERRPALDQRVRGQPGSEPRQW